MKERVNWNDYRAAMDDLPISNDFEARVCAVASRVPAAAPPKRKQHAGWGGLGRSRAAFARAAVVAVACLALAGTAYATVSLDDLAAIAAGAGDEEAAVAFAEAFTEGNGVAVDETQRVGDFDFTLCGVAMGRNFTAASPEVKVDRTYAVLAVSRADGEPITDEALAQADEAWLASGTPQADGSIEIDHSSTNRSEDGFSAGGPALADLFVTPVVAGDDDWSVGRKEYSLVSYDADGVMYLLADVADLRDVSGRAYLAVYRGWGQFPGDELFVQNPDGTVSFAEGVAGALFEIPKF